MLRVTRAERTPSNRVKVTANYGITGEDRTMEFSCTPEEFMDGLKAYHENNQRIQYAFSFLSVVEREFMMTGMYPEEQELRFDETNES